MGSQEAITSLLQQQRELNMRRKHKQKVMLYPYQQEKTYKRYLREVAAYAKMLVDVRLMPYIDRFGVGMDVIKEVRNDSIADDVERIIAGIRFSIESRFPASARQAAALAAANSVTRYNKEQFAAKVLVPNNLPVPVVEPWLEEWIDSFSYVNTRLISTIPEKMLDDVQIKVNQGLLEGQLTGTIKEEIRKAYGVSDRRAAVIARDQISKLNGQINQTRQTKAGFNEYIWRTAGDESVRPSHEAKEGNKYSWDDPPNDTGHPGEDFNCRCWAEPVLEGFTEEEDS